MIQSLKKTVATAGARGLLDGISGTWLRQMTYSICRFWAYDQSKKLIGADAKSPAWKLAIAGSMGKRSLVAALSIWLLMIATAGGIAGMVGNPGEIMMVRMQADMAKPPEKRLNYKHSIDGLIRVSLILAVAGGSSLGHTICVDDTRGGL